VIRCSCSLGGYFLGHGNLCCLADSIVRIVYANLQLFCLSMIGVGNAAENTHLMDATALH
jgi:hypothetical protein